MAGVNPDHCLRIEGGREKWEAHDVIPVKVGLEEIVGLAVTARIPAHRIQAELAQPASHVADEVGTIAGFKLDAGRGAAVRRAHREAQFLFDERLGLGFVGEASSGGGDKGAGDLFPDDIGRRRNRQRTPGAPETHEHKVLAPFRSRLALRFDRVADREQLVVAADRQDLAHHLVR